VVRKDGGGWKIEVADDWQCPKWGGSSLVHSGHSGKKCKGKGLDTCYSALSVGLLCAQLTRDLLAISKFLFYTTETSFPLFFSVLLTVIFRGSPSVIKLIRLLAAVDQRNYITDHTVLIKINMLSAESNFGENELNLLK